MAREWEGWQGTGGKGAGGRGAGGSSAGGRVRMAGCGWQGMDGRVWVGAARWKAWERQEGGAIVAVEHSIVQ